MNAPGFSDSPISTAAQLNEHIIAEYQIELAWLET
jgi:hypothetical protein